MESKKYVANNDDERIEMPRMDEKNENDIATWIYVWSSVWDDWTTTGVMYLYTDMMLLPTVI